MLVQPLQSSLNDFKNAAREGVLAEEKRLGDVQNSSRSLSLKSHPGFDAENVEHFMDLDD